MASTDEYEVTSKIQPEDVQWLSSLSDSELDFFICLKKLVILRAKVIGYEGIEHECDLKTLRAIGLKVIEHLKERMKDSSVLPGLEVASLLNGCNLFNSIQIDKLDPMVIDKISTLIVESRKKKTSSSQTQLSHIYYDAGASSSSAPII